MRTFSECTPLTKENEKKKRKKVNSIEDFSEYVPLTKEPSESISMPRIENDTPGGEKEGKKQISKRESAQREHFNVADRELCAKEIFFLKKREPQERKLPARAASQQKRKCPAKGQFFCFFVPARATFRTKKSQKH